MVGCLGGLGLWVGGWLMVWWGWVVGCGVGGGGGLVLGEGGEGFEAVG
jgi:hypothetical protein